MELLIYTQKDNIYEEFEIVRLRKTIKNSLEMNDEVYITSPFSYNYKIAQYFSVHDLSNSEYKRLKEKNIKLVLTLLYAENDINGSIIFFETLKDNTTKLYIKKDIVEKINRFDAILVPSTDGEEFLKENGITSKIYIFRPGLNREKYNLNGLLGEKICFRGLQMQNDTKFFLTYLNLADEENLKNIIEIAKFFKEFKVVVLLHSFAYEKKSKNIKKMIKKAPSNIKFVESPKEDLRASLIYNETAYLSLSNIYPQNLGILSSLNAKKGIFLLKPSIISSVVEDNHLGFVYNDLESLKKDLNKFIEGDISIKQDKINEFYNSNTTKGNGKYLIKIYESILKEK